MKKLKDKLKGATTGDIIYFTCFIISIGLLVFGAITPPPAEIHPSILKAVGLMGVFSTIYKIGDWIKLGIDIRFKKGDVEVEIDNNENKK